MNWEGVLVEGRQDVLVDGRVFVEPDGAGHDVEALLEGVPQRHDGLDASEEHGVDGGLEDGLVKSSEAADDEAGDQLLLNNQLLPFLLGGNLGHKVPGERPLTAGSVKVPGAQLPSGGRTEVVPGDVAAGRPICWVQFTRCVLDEVHQYVLILEVEELLRGELVEGRDVLVVVPPAVHVGDDFNHSVGEEDGKSVGIHITCCDTALTVRGDGDTAGLDGAVIEDFLGNSHGGDQSLELRPRRGHAGLRGHLGAAGEEGGVVTVRVDHVPAEVGHGAECESGAVTVDDEFWSALCLRVVDGAGEEQFTGGEHLSEQVSPLLLQVVLQGRVPCVLPLGDLSECNLELD